jgi:hypothetical protein
MIAARNSWCVAFDNLSGLPVWLSDALCRLSTGGGLSKRELYTDEGEILFDATRPILLNGIDAVVTRGDLMDRSTVLWCPIIPEAEKKTETALRRAFKSAWPRVLGALLGAVVCALQRFDTVKLDRLPRMADSTQWIVAAEPALGWAPGTFLKAYAANRALANSVVLDSSVIALPMRELLAQSHGSWSGSPTELWQALRKRTEDASSRDWPKSPSALTEKLSRIGPNLRAAGITIQHERGAKRRTITIRNRPVLAAADTKEQPSTEPTVARRFPRKHPMRFPRRWPMRFPRRATPEVLKKITESLPSDVPEADDAEDALGRAISHIIRKIPKDKMASPTKLSHDKNPPWVN